MKILLVQPAKGSAALAGDDFYCFEPLALELLGAAVRPHHDVRLVDLRLGADLAAVLQEFAPEVVGVTAYSVNVHPALEICADVKDWNPRCLTVVGGHHATVRGRPYAP
ncbi:MAG: cobalamin B12-binding domain-containing protein [Deltaproteobacteria bacterium]|nr:cobalamin B12-binding domain-containing protein [Deltaproteobacteria bacterium]